MERKKEWQNVRLGNICTKVCSGGTPTSTNPAYYNGNVPWLNTNEVNFCNIYSTNRTISEEGLKQSAAKYVPENTIIVAMYGVTAGKCAITKIPLTTNQACCNLIIDKEKADYRYVFYYLKQQSNYLNRLAVGGAQQNLNAITIKKFQIALPSLPIQQKIASILSTYDTLIENNNRRIHLLEQMAENLYKEWFVRFRFPGHEKVEMENGLPKGWKVEKLGEYANISTGKCNREDAEEDGIYPLFDRSQEIKKSNNWIKDCEAIIVPGEGTSFIPRYYKGKFNLHQRCYCIEPTIEYTGFYLFYSIMLNRKYFLSVATGATVPSLRQNNFTNMKLVIADMKVIRKYNKIANIISLQIDKLAHQNTLLTRQRDLLLPRLMSGKLEVKP
ncbi:restriction endonuclease subunit S [Prevotella intermedia]|uniref:Restriction endonuclease subunit S n=1 Tax=Prevotella intermedia TaxID=28131 RepID=A0A2M8M433_PREIN|nr:restriction endonuclease subunit S [Prevotella intermedia]PJE98952.1 restriction endonuclease subunit S [Prevotella intermedia]